MRALCIRGAQEVNLTPLADYYVARKSAGPLRYFLGSRMKHKEPFLSVLRKVVKTCQRAHKEHQSQGSKTNARDAGLLVLFLMRLICGRKYIYVTRKRTAPSTFQLLLKFFD